MDKDNEVKIIYSEVVYTYEIKLKIMPVGGEGDFGDWPTHFP